MEAFKDVIPKIIYRLNEKNTKLKEIYIFFYLLFISSFLVSTLIFSTDCIVLPLLLLDVFLLVPKPT